VHETAPDAPGIARALKDAYDRAGLTPDEIDLIYVHGTGTGLNDATEGAVLGQTFADAGRKPALSGLKAMTGHTSGASGGIGVVAAIKSLERNAIPPTPGTTQPLDVIEGFGLSDRAFSAPVETVQVNAFGFGGVNSVVLVSRYKEPDHAL
jgi:3-oxoacyl-[acyl-carrier-protein] synthase II